MCRVISKAAIVFLLIVAFVSPVTAAEVLVSINGVEYTDQDYRDWWKYWQEPGMDFFDSPENFVNFHLLAQQGRQMEYHLTPRFQRTVEVFTKVRSLALLKYEEVDTKIKVTEEQVRAEFAERYAPIWSIQLLAYDDQDKARALIDQMKPFAGQRAGRLVFADAAGIEPENGGPLHYEELQLFPARINNDRDFWLPVLSELEAGEVSEPLYIESQARYYVIRLDEVSAPDEALFENKRAGIERQLEKEQSGELTGRMMEKLIEKYHLQIDQEFLQSLDLDKDYPEEILAKPVVRMDDYDFTAELLIQNAKKQRPMRKDITDDELKRMVVDFFISQVLTDKEALDRHYEERPPFKSQYEFYVSNTLRKSLLADIRQKIEVSDEEIASYYEKNLSSYTRPAIFSYAEIRGEEDLLHRVRRGISRGGDFFVEAQKFGLDAEMQTTMGDGQEGGIPEELAKLQKGEVSQPFAETGTNNYRLIKLLDNRASEPIPLEKVFPEIKKLLAEEKYEAVKKNYLAEVRALSEIKINRKVWKKLKEEYEDA